MPVRGPMLLHRMALVSFRLFCKNLGNLQEFFGQMVYRPPWPKIARTPMADVLLNLACSRLPILPVLFSCSRFLNFADLTISEPGTGHSISITQSTLANQIAEFLIVC